MTQIANYNGWSNRETWLASLWLNNDESRHSLLAQAKKRQEHELLQAAWLAERVNEQLEWFVDSAPDYYQSSLWVDMLHAAFYRVDWYEIIAKN